MLMRMVDDGGKRERLARVFDGNKTETGGEISCLFPSNIRFVSHLKINYKKETKTDFGYARYN